MRDLLSKIRSNRGYNLLEMLLCLLALSLMLSLVYPLLITTNKLLQLEKYRYQDEIGIYQLQIVLATNKIITVNDDSIEYLTYENECEISIVNDNLISQPGFLCFLYHIDGCSFDIRDEIIYLEYWREGEVWEYAIAYKEKK